MMENLKKRILELYPTVASFCREAKISDTQMYDIINGKKKLTPIMKRRIWLALADKERRDSYESYNTRFDV